MRVRIFLNRCAMRGPAGVANAGFPVPNGFLILDVGPAMNIESKFGVCLICMLALVLLAVTPSTATWNDAISSSSTPAPTGMQHDQQYNIKRSYALTVDAVHIHGS